LLDIKQVFGFFRHVISIAQRSGVRQQQIKKLAHGAFPQKRFQVFLVKKTVSKMIYFHITLVYALIKTRNGITANASTKFG